MSQAVPGHSKCPLNLRPHLSVTQLVWVLVIATLVIGGIGFGVTAWSDRETAMTMASGDLSETTLLMQEHTRATLETQTAILGQVEALVRSQGMTAIPADPAIAANLRLIAAEAPIIRSLWIMDAKGDALATSLESFKGPENFSERKYFQAVLPPSPRKVVISPMIVGKVGGRLLVPVSRRLEDADGRFLGVTVSFLSAEHFLGLYRRLDPNPDSLFGLYTPDGRVVIRQPLPTAEQTAEGVRAGPLSQHLKSAPDGMYIAASSFDGIQRLTSYRSIPEHGLALLAGRSLPSILADCRRRTLRSAIWTGSALTVLMLLAALALRAARRCEKATHTALDANHTKSTFFASASHDLRQPYQAMRLFWMVIEGRAAALGDAKLISAVHNMDSAMTAGEELLSALLDVATIDAGRVVPRLSDVPISDIVAAELASFTKLAEVRGLSLRMARTDAMVRTDPTLLRRILRNLVVNALKYTETGGVLIGCRKRGTSILLQVWDTGRGIPEDQHRAIFEDFYQIDNPARNRAQGLGLGLAVVARTARLLDHTVQLKSRVGQGTVFTVMVPRSLQPPPAHPDFTGPT